MGYGVKRMSTVAQTISDITRKHLEQDNGLLLGQCISAVGWVGGTVPNCKNIVEISTSEGSNSGLAVGVGLMGRRPIYVIRYQGFMWIAANSIVNYAAKSKEIWDVPCPILVRSIAMEGNGIGPTASSSQHAMVMRMPGIAVFAPMTPNEWKFAWDWFMKHDDPVYCSEHRRSFTLTEEMPNIISSTSKITILAISAARLNCIDAINKLKKDGIDVDLFHLNQLKPLIIPDGVMESLCKTQIGMVVDSDFELCGAAESISYHLTIQTGVKVFALGLEDRNCGMSKESENITPSAEKILTLAKEFINAKS